MNLNLETLRREIVAYLEASEFAVFHREPHSFDGTPAAPWDVERFPDYRTFLDVARKAGVKVVTFSASEFGATEVEDLDAHIEISDLDADQKRDCKKQLRDFHSHVGEICSLDLTFDYNSRCYVYHARPEWYQEFLALEEEVMSQVFEEDDEDDSSLGGYFSRN